jgi:hypothetical protein
LRHASHIVAKALNVGKHIVALLEVDARNSIAVLWLVVSNTEPSTSLQQTGLKSKSEGSFGVGDSIAGFRDVDVKNGFSRHFLQRRLGAEGRNEPAKKVNVCP